LLTNVGEQKIIIKNEAGDFSNKKPCWLELLKNIFFYIDLLTPLFLGELPASFYIIIRTF